MLVSAAPPPPDEPTSPSDDHTTITYGGGTRGGSESGGIIDDAELRLCGDLSGGKRAIELGVSDQRNALAFAAAGAKAIAVDPDPLRIDTLRADASALDLHVECHVGELADLGFATSGSVELVVADHTLGDVDDLGRSLRQVHRVLKSGHAFVIVVDHPFGEVMSDPTRPYGSGSRTLGEWLTALSRANFRVDTVHELGVDAAHPAPSTLVLRARKEGS